MTVLAVGKNSFLARVVAAAAPHDWLFLSHQDALVARHWPEDARCIVNFSFAPSFKNAGYDPVSDIDSHLARMIGHRPIHYVMLSSRLAYGPASGDFGLREGQGDNPDTPYGRAKHIVEDSVRAIVGDDRLTVLRLSNVFGHEPGRDTFFGRMMTGLAQKGRIDFDIDPLSVRDFLPVEDFARALVAIVNHGHHPVPGLFNLGAGFGVTCGEAARWLIEGYGSGSLAVNGHSTAGQFWLDMTRTRAVYGLPDFGRGDLRAAIIAGGRRLRG